MLGMFDPATLEFQWRYMVHADARVLDASRSVPDEGYDRDQRISLGSIHKLLVHCVFSQETWLARLNGLPNPPSIDVAGVPRGAIAGRWAAVHQEMLAFAAAQTRESLESVLRFTNSRGAPFELSTGACMLHVADHATYHRGQLNSMIKLAGGTPSPVMLYTFAVENGQGREGWSEKVK